MMIAAKYIFILSLGAVLFKILCPDLPAKVTTLRKPQGLHPEGFLVSEPKKERRHVSSADTEDSFH